MVTRVTDGVTNVALVGNVTICVTAKLGILDRAIAYNTTYAIFYANMAILLHKPLSARHQP